MTIYYILGINLHIESNVIDVAYLRLTETAHYTNAVRFTNRKIKRTDDPNTTYKKSDEF